MENNERSLRKRKSDENNLDLDRDVKKLYNPRQQKVRKQEMKDERKEEGKLNAKTQIKDGLMEGTCIPYKQPEKIQGMIEDVGRVTRGKKKRTDSGKSKTPDQMRAPIRAKGKESKEKTHKLQEKTSHNDILKRKVDASKTRPQFNNNTGGITNEIKDLECLKTKNVNLQKEIKTLQAEKCKLNIELNRSKGDENKWKENALAEKDDNKRLKQERAAMEKKIDKLGYDLQVKINNENLLKHDLETQRTQLKEEIRSSRKCKDDLEALQRGNDKMHKQLNDKDVEMVNQVEIQNNLSKKKIETAQELKELSNKLIKMKDDALKKENKLKTELAESEKHLKTERENCCQLITENKLLSQTNKEFETELFNVKKENEKSHKQIDNLERQLRDVSSENKMLKSNSVHNERVSETKKATIENEMADLQRDKTLLQKKISVLNDKIQELQETLTTETKLHETKILDLKRQLKLVQDDKSETEKTLNSLRQDHKKLQQMYDIIKQEIDRFKAIKTVQSM
jgi:chromosome segregation ATPase